MILLTYLHNCLEVGIVGITTVIRYCIFGGEESKAGYLNFLSFPNPNPFSVIHKEVGVCVGPVRSWRLGFLCFAINFIIISPAQSLSCSTRFIFAVPLRWSVTVSLFCFLSFFFFFLFKNSKFKKINCLKVHRMNGKVFLRELYFAGKQYLSTLSKNDILFVKWNVIACFLMRCLHCI